MEWHLVIIDRSASMRQKINGVINGYNKLIADHNKNSNRLTVFTFSNNTTEIYDGKMNEAVDMLTSQIIPEGGTALIDAVGTAYTKIIQSNETYQCIRSELHQTRKAIMYYNR